MAGLLEADSLLAGAPLVLGIFFFCFFKGSLSARAAGRLPSGAACTAGTDGLDSAGLCEAQRLLAPTAGFSSSLGFLAGFAVTGAVGKRHCVWPCCMCPPLAFFFFSTRASMVCSMVCHSCG